jgi:carboxypeptidase Taq
MVEYLGVEVTDDAHGILQDTHWANGTFGYFPSYAIGSAYAAQFLHAMEASFDVEAAVAAGDLGPVRAWLGERVWRHGSAKDPAQVVLDATGEAFDPRYYTDYLVRKYRGVYGL